MSNDLRELQAAWDSVDSLPPLIFTEAEGHSLLTALFAGIMLPEAYHPAKDTDDGD